MALLRALGRVGGVALGALALVLLIDAWWRPTDGAMVGLALVASLAGLVTAVRLLWPLRRSPGETQVARLVEERCPDLEDRVVTAADVAVQPARSPLAALVLRDAARRLHTLSLDRVIPRGQLGRPALRAVAVGLAVVVLLATGWESVVRLGRTAWLFVAPSARLVVEPGAARVPVGEPLVITARVDGFLETPLRTPPAVEWLPAPSGSPEPAPGAARVMAVTGDTFRLEVPQVLEDFRYRVVVGGLTSDVFDVRAISPPRVEQVDVVYRYPAFTQLPPRVEEDSGDVYAPVGTTVTLRVHFDKAIDEGAVDLTAGDALALHPVDDRSAEATLVVGSDDSYRVSAVDHDGLRGGGDVEYFIRTIVDQPPVVEVTRPAGDREITSLEEVVIEARVRDDFGLERVELVYTPAGQPVRTVDLAGARRALELDARHTVYAESLEVEPGDVISYYLQAVDTNPGPTAAPVRSDIFFLEVRPFDREFEEALSQAGGAADPGGLGRLADVQKQIIVATWAVDRRPADDDARTQDLTVVADAQEELRWATDEAAEQILGRGLARPGSDRSSAQEIETLRAASAAMEMAERHLRDGEPAPAVAPETEALRALLRAEAALRRQQVATSSSAGGGEGSGAREDLSALFDEDLRRDQRTSYEEPAPANPGTQEPDTETLERLAELAARQDALADDQERLAEDDDLTEDERRRELARLRREQEELRAEADELARQIESAGGGTTDSQETRAASQAMRDALSGLAQGDAGGAAEQGRQAAERLRGVGQARSGQAGSDEADGSSARSAAIGSRLGDLAEEQRRLAEATEQAATDGARADAPEELGRQADAAARDLAEAEAELRAGTDDGAGEAWRDAADALRDREVTARAEALADALRAAGTSGDEGGAPEPGGVPQPGAQEDGALERIAREQRALADDLEDAAGQLARAGGAGEAPGREARGGQADALRGRLDEIDEQMARTGRPGPGGEALLREVADSQELIEALRRQRPDASRDLEAWAQDWRSQGAPGDEAFKLDVAEWAVLSEDLRLAIELFEAGASRGRGAPAVGATVGPTGEAPEGYRRSVDEYYRALALPREP